MVVEVGALAVPLAGEASAGAAGATMIVVKLQMLDQPLVLPALLALASQ
jgi:hypothetical protein